MIIISACFIKYNANSLNGKILLTLPEEKELDIVMFLLALPVKMQFRNKQKQLQKNTLCLFQFKNIGLYLHKYKVSKNVAFSYFTL